MFLLIAAAMAAAPLAGATLQHEAEERARAEATDLLRTLCPEQCVVLSVAARVDEEDAGGERTPGFETPGARTVPVLRSVSAILLGGVLLVLGGLFYFAARRPAEPTYADLPLEGTPESSPEAQRDDAFPATRARKLEKQLVDDRALRNAVIREALGKGEHALVARWVRELGEFLLEDLRGDGALAPALKALASEVAKPLDPALRATTLQALEGRTLATRLSRAGEADAFAFLEGVRPEAFLAAWRGLSPGAQEVALRLAPAHLRAAALRELPAAQRQEIALTWARKPEVSAGYALAAADELRARIADLHAGPSAADRALADMLDSLSREEQDALLEKLRREGDSRALPGLMTESSLASAPLDLLSTAALAIGPANLVAYLAGADETVRTHVLKACPPRLRAEVEEAVEAVAEEEAVSTLVRDPFRERGRTATPAPRSW